MADLVLGLAKTTVEGTVSMARAAMDEEDKLKKSVQRDLLIISDEFEMMHAFLEDAKDRVTDNVTRTLVRQVRNMALDVEDCIETIVYLDNKPHWWRRMKLPWCMPTAAPGKDLDAVVANVEQLKARVDAMGLRKLRYNRIDECCHKPVEQMHQQAVANAMVPNIFVAAADAAKKQSSRMDLVTLINKNLKDDSGRKNRAEEEKEERGDDQEKEEETEQEEKDKKKVVDDLHQLKVISLLGTGSDLEIMSIKKAYDDSETCKSFKIRAWVKVVHPFNPFEFIRSLLAQFYRSLCTQQEKAVDFLEVLVATNNELIVDFMCQIKLKYLVVLEDVSTMVDWEAVRGYLPDKENGSCIIVHTRRFEIACSCVGLGYQISELEKSSTDHSAYVLYKEDADRKVIDAVDQKKILPYEQWRHENPLFGRDEDLRSLSYWLTYPGDVVSVWGISGVGKSFLIQHFYRKEQDVASSLLLLEFPLRRRKKCYTKFAWVNVPRRPFDFRDFWRSLLSELNPDHEGQMMSTIKDPMLRCREYIQKEKEINYLIVIDGLQSIEDWDLIRPTFESDTSSHIPSNVAIIIITNEESVANYCCAAGKKLVWNVKGLEVSHAIKLFNQVVIRNSYFWEWNQNSDEMKRRNEQIRDILVEKCGGLPKVICAVAKSWRIFRDTKVKDNLVSKLEAMRKQRRLTGSLEGMLSWFHAYFSSCQDFLKPCIFYLTIFPLNHTIRRRRLVRRWIVEGYTWNNKQITAEETANEFFSRLVNLNMIQSPRQRNPASSTRMPLCQVNGFIREYVLSQSMEENFVFELEGNCKDLQRDPGTNHNYTKGMATGCIVQHLAINKTWDRDRNVFERIDFSRLHSLTVFGSWESFFISDKMVRLRVLDLEDVSSGLTNGDVENMVKLLPRLKFLSLRGCREISRMPDSLGDLKQLQTLDIRETSVINLPKSIIKLDKLQYIRAGRAVNLDDNNTAGTSASLPVAAVAANPSMSSTPIIRKPHATQGSFLSKFSIHRRLYDGPHNGLIVLRGIGKLSSLLTLGVLNINVECGEDILEELKKLTLLHKLGVSGISRNNSEKLFSAISHLPHLESLSLQFQLNQDHEAAIALSRLVKLRSLKLYGLVNRVPSWIMQMCMQLPRLEQLNLQMKTLPHQELDLILTLRYLRSLRLRLTEFEDGELRFGWNIASGGWIINFLDIACNSSLQAVRFGSKIDVEILKIRCSCVTSSLQFYGLQCLDTLKEVWLSGSYDNAFKEHLENELKKNTNKPILKLEELSSST